MTNLLRTLFILLTAWLRAIWYLVITLCRSWRKRWEKQKELGGDQSVKCLPIPSDVFLRADPSIYDQEYLMSLGLPVTWDNPDIVLKDSLGNTVDSFNLAADTQYVIEATVHNRSNQAPAPGMQVQFTLFSWGVGGQVVQNIGQDIVDLPVRGAAGEPTIAKATWKTPTALGHYCIMAEAIWADDANPFDDRGQENTQVTRSAAGARLAFQIPVRNTQQGKRRLGINLDSYSIPAKPLLRKTTISRGEHAQTETDPQFLHRIVEANDRRNFQAPLTWRPSLSSKELVLNTDENATIEFSVAAPDEAKRGTEQRFNVSVSDLDTRHVVGGLTFICQVQ